MMKVVVLAGERWEGRAQSRHLALMVKVGHGVADVLPLDKPIFANALRLLSGILHESFSIPDLRRPSKSWG
jgi:hypothetical protein